MLSKTEANESTEIRVAAGAGLRNTMLELQEVYQKIHTPFQINYTFAGAGELHRQIEQGSGHDLIILPEAGGHLDNLEGSGFLKAISRRRLFQDHLVLLLNRKLQTGSRMGLEWLTAPEVQTVAIGKPGMALFTWKKTRPRLV